MAEEHSLPQLTREVAAKMIDMEQIEKVTGHNGSIGAIDFRLSSKHAFASRRIHRMLPDGWTQSMVVTPNCTTTMYIEKE